MKTENDLIWDTLCIGICFVFLVGSLKSCEVEQSSFRHQEAMKRIELACPAPSPSPTDVK